MKLVLKSIYIVVTLVVSLSCSGVDNEVRNDPKAIELNNRAMTIVTKYQFVHISKVVFEMDSALTLLDSAILIDENYRTAYLNKVNVLSKLGRLNDVIEAVSVLIKKNEKDAEAYSLRGLYFEKNRDLGMAKKDYEMAIKAYDLRILENPNDLDAKTGKIFISAFIYGKEHAMKEIQILEKKYPKDMRVLLIKEGMAEFDRKKHIQEL